jgi:hypothetical protein
LHIGEEGWGLEPALPKVSKGLSDLLHPRSVVRFEATFWRIWHIWRISKIDFANPPVAVWLQNDPKLQANFIAPEPGWRIWRIWRQY